MCAWGGVLLLVAAAWAGVQPAIAEAPDCTKEPISEERTVELIAADLSALPASDSQDVRYITLASLANSCAPPQKMQLYRHAVIKLLNSLSWAPQPARFDTIDPDGAIIRLRLTALGWTATEWQRLLHIYPYGLQPKSQAFATITKLTGSPLAYLRGDWFAHTASRPPHYYNLLKLPRSFRILQTKIEPDAAAGIQSYWARRTGYTKVETEDRIRLLPQISYTEKPPVKDHAPKPQDGSAFPKSTNLRTVPRQVIGTSLFTLPNGFRAYFVHHVTGPRLNASPMHPCQICNFAGLSERSGDDSAQLKIGGLYPVSPDRQAAVRSGEAKRNEAMTVAGLDPALVSEAGLEPIRAFSEKFAGERLTIESAAAEVGLARDIFEQKLLNAGKTAVHTARVLAQQSMSRHRFQARFKEIAETTTGLTALRNSNVGGLIGLGSTIPRSNWQRRRAGGFEMSLVSDKSAYTRGDLAELSIRPQLSCNLTLISVNADGSGVVIFPNRFSQETYIPGGRIKTVPGKSTPYKLRLNDAGTEKIISFCNADGRWSGVKHHFGKSPFTRIKDVDKYLKSRKDHLAKLRSASRFGYPPLIASSNITFTVD